MVLGYGTPNKLMADIWHCPPPSVSVAPLSTCANTYARPPTLAPSVPFGSPSCLLLWPDEPPLFICYYTGIVRSKNQEGACVCASTVGCRAATPPVLSSALSLSIDQPRLGLDGPAQAVCPRGRCARRSPQLTFRLPPSGLARCLPASLQRRVGGAFNSANED